MVWGAVEGIVGAYSEESFRESYRLARGTYRIVT
jgi:hypothetical protein